MQRRRIHRFTSSLIPVMALAFSPACKDDAGEAESAGTESDSAGTASDTEGEDAGTDTADTDSGPGLDLTPPPGGFRRLLGHQYVHSIEYLLGSSAAQAAEPPADQALGGLDAIGATQLPLPPTSVEQYERSAGLVADAVVNNPSRLTQTVPCIGEASPGDACYDDLVRDFGRLAWRRPLTDDEVAGLVALAQDAREWGGGDFMTGVRYVVAALLQSPNFLYITEVGEADGFGGLRLTPLELASRMSFFILGRTPDAALLDAAENGALETREDIRATALELLERDEARRALKTFYSELWNLRDLPTKGKDTSLFPAFSPALAADMQQEILLLLEHIAFEKDSNILEILDANYTFVNGNLASLYGVTAPDPQGWARVELPAEQNRAGFLTRAGWLTAFSHPVQNSPTRRGLFIQQTLLCHEIPEPPPDVNPTLPEPTEETTLRARVEQHMENAACAPCHAQMDPIGFAFENYSAIGEYRTLDNGYPIDASGEVSAVGSWNNAADLAALLREDPRTPDCLIRNVFRGSIGVVETEDQEEAFALLGEAFADSDYNLKQVMAELTVSDVFRRVDLPK